MPQIMYVNTLSGGLVRVDGGKIDLRWSLKTKNVNIKVSNMKLIIIVILILSYTVIVNPISYQIYFYLYTVKT